ncbi:hypothetical protein CBR_g12756 [Chara braunii]|uniref:ATP-dependent DNA helicase n=1 Tax=Chara braunii TaxID=69332 RepID=A0A388KSR1_CHABU|nr:hypothetical protein CBR_g12756 [Chara braunii]|eukprot:GBG73038.1 hypothetical protein CBR_g12756 [Chara braunii]
MKGSISHRRPAAEQSGRGTHQRWKVLCSSDSQASSVSSACPVPAAELRDVLKRVFGYPSFRGPQEDAICAVLSGRDCFCLMPTGGGKSLCYELPAVVKLGVTLVVSPLIALMENQVSALKKKNIAAEFLSSTREASDRRKIYEDIDSGRPTVRLLYVTPELISTDGFMGKLQKMHGRGLLNLIAIDEAHCISSWGHDFRPSYRKLSALRSALAGVPILALTATAAKAVRDDIIRSLRLHQPVVLMSSFNRPNIFYEVRYKELLGDPYKDLVRTLRMFPGQCAIVYCLARNTCDDIASRLLSEGVPCNVYHAGMKDASRSKSLTEWTSGKVNIVIATVAFGMGIDRADVRLVCHFNVPKTLEGFYQESGRAGRDGSPARSLLYYGLEDCRTMQFILRKEVNKQKKSHGDKQAAQHGVDAFSEMVKYCEEVSCRRQKVLGHFGEKTTPALCNKTCDVCKFPSRVENDVNSLRNTALMRGRGGTDRVFIQSGEDRVFHGTRASEFWESGEDSAEGAESISSSDDDVEKQAASAAQAAVGRASNIDQRLKQLMAAEERFSAACKRPAGEMRHALTESSRETARQRLTMSLEKSVQNEKSGYRESPDATIMALAFEEDLFVKYGKKGRPVYNSQMASMVRWLATASATQVQDRFRECGALVGVTPRLTGVCSPVNCPTGQGHTAVVSDGGRGNAATEGAAGEEKEVGMNGNHSGKANACGVGRARPSGGMHEKEVTPPGDEQQLGAEARPGATTGLRTPGLKEGIESKTNGDCNAKGAGGEVAKTGASGRLGEGGHEGGGETTAVKITRLQEATAITGSDDGLTHGKPREGQVAEEGGSCELPGSVVNASSGRGGAETSMEKTNGAADWGQEQGREVMQAKASNGEGVVNPLGREKSRKEEGPGSAPAGVPAENASNEDTATEPLRPRPKILSFGEFLKNKQEAKRQSAQAEHIASKRRREEQSSHAQGRKRHPSTVRRERAEQLSSDAESKRRWPQV